MTVPAPSARCSRLIASLTLSASLLFLPGCIGYKIRELKTQNQMKQAHIMQLSQDKEALEEEVQILQTRVETLDQKLENREAQLTRLKQNLEMSEEKLVASRVALNTSVESTSREVGKQLADALEREAELKFKIEDLKSKVSSLEFEILKGETSLEEQQSKFELLEKEKAQKIEKLELLQKKFDEALAANEALKNEHQLELASLTTKHESRETVLLEETEMLKKKLNDSEDSYSTAESDIRLLKEMLDEKNKQLKSLEDEIEIVKTEIASRPPEQEIAEVKKGPSRDLSEEKSLAEKYLEKHIASGLVDVKTTEDSLRIVLYCDSLFQPSTTLLSDGGLDALQKIEEIAAKVPHQQITVAGHSDNIPVGNMPYPDNWELAAARASEVCRWLAAQPAIAEEKLVAQSHSYHKPIADNRTVQGRKMNRRVEVDIKP